MSCAEECGIGLGGGGTEAGLASFLPRNHSSNALYCAPFSPSPSLPPAWVAPPSTCPLPSSAPPPPFPPFPPKVTLDGYCSAPPLHSSLPNTCASSHCLFPPAPLAPPSGIVGCCFWAASTTSAAAAATARQCQRASFTCTRRSGGTGRAWRHSPAWKTGAGRAGKHGAGLEYLLFMGEGRQAGKEEGWLCTQRFAPKQIPTL